MANMAAEKPAEFNDADTAGLPRAAGPRSTKRPLLAAALIVFCEGFVVWAVFPVAYFYCEELGAPHKQAQLWVGLGFLLQSLPKVVFNPLFGCWSDRLGRRPLLALASAGTLLGSLLWGAALNVWWFLASRTLAGIFGAQAGLANAVVADTLPPGRRTHGMALLGAAFALSMVLGPLLGGLMVVQGSHALIGWVGAAMQGVSILTALFLMRETHPRPIDAAAPVAAAPDPPPSQGGVGGGSVGGGSLRLRELLRQPHVPALMSVTFLSMFALQQFTTTFAGFSDTRLQMSEEHVTWAFALFGGIGALVQGGALRPLAKRYSDRALAIAGMICLVVGSAALLVPAPLSVVWLWAAVIGVGAALSAPTVTALLSHAVDARHQGELLGAQQAVTGLGRSLGAGIAGALFVTLGPTLPYIGAAAAAAICILLLAQAPATVVPQPANPAAATD